MSIKKAILVCKECGKEFEVTYDTIIDGVKNSELRKKVLDRTLFRVECPHYNLC